MRRGFAIGMVILFILVAIAIGVGAYNVGLHQGLEQSGRAGDVVRVIGPGFGFPFGLILFPLFLFGIFALFRGAFWHRGWGPDHHDGPWQGRRAMLEDWHRRQHEEGSDDRPASGGEPASV
jgi:hypothetical protein